MSQNLTQPEEVDHVLMEMASHDMEADTPEPDVEQSNDVVHNFECDWSIGLPDH